MAPLAAGPRSGPSPRAGGGGAAGGGGRIRGSPGRAGGDPAPRRRPLTRQCTKQLISERFGRGSRTVDLELETQIELLRETKRKYECVLQLARALTNHFYSLVQTQHALGDAFADLSQKSPELQVRPPGRRRVPRRCRAPVPGEGAPRPRWASGAAAQPGWLPAPQQPGA